MAVAAALVLHACGGVSDSPLDPPPRDPAAEIEVGLDASFDTAVPAKPKRPVLTADGVCDSQSGALSQGVLDPDCVYAAGFVALDSRFKRILFDPKHPSDRAFGLGRLDGQPIIHPSTGSVYFVSAGETRPKGLYKFRFAVESSANDDADLVAQEIVPLPTCPGPTQSITFNLFPDDGAIARHCVAPTQTLVGGQPLPIDRNGYSVAAVGPNRAILGVRPNEVTGTGIVFALVRGGATVPIDALADTMRVVATRGRPAGGFFMARRTSELDDTIERVEISDDGAVKSLGTYQVGRLPPNDLDAKCALDGLGALECIRPDPNASTGQAIVHYSLTAPPVVVYAQSGSDISLHGAELATGP